MDVAVGFVVVGNQNGLMLVPAHVAQEALASLDHTLARKPASRVEPVDVLGHEEVEPSGASEIRERFVGRVGSSLAISCASTSSRTRSPPA